MSFSDKGSSDNEALVDSMSTENSSLNEGNLQALSNADFHTLTELSLHSEMETDDREVVIESQEVIEHEEEVETEDAEIEPQHINSHFEEEVLHEVKTKPNTIPPLRPLTIAPKPTKVPVSVKPVAGQQLFLVQGSGAGQTIKLLSSQGQELNVANLINRPVTLKPTFKTIQSQSGNISIVQQKPVVMKKMVTPGQKVITKPITTLPKQAGQHFMVVQKTDQQPLKLVQTQGGNIVTGTTKTITLQQAQEMGLLSNAKIISQGQNVQKQTVLLKNAPKTLKLVPQVSPALVTGSATANTKTVTLSAIKSPTKILPATSVAGNKGPQRIIFKTSTGSNQTIIPSGQIIQVAGSQGLNSGQLHQINIPGKGMQYIKFVTASTPDATATVSSNAVKTTAVASSSNLVFSEIKPVTVSKQIAPKPVKTATVAVSKNTTPPQVVVIPALGGGLTPVGKVAIPPSPKPPKLQPPVNSSESTSPLIAKPDDVDANGMRPRKPCNCTKSQCLKLYCDCFANGEFCYMCKCMNCFNNLDNEEHRNRAIKACLERNPHAFKPKIGKDRDVAGDMAVRKHTKGCNCKRSGCLKNYCECYEAKIACSNNCKCIGCCNVEDNMEKKSIRHISSAEKATNTPIMQVGKTTQTRESTYYPRRSSSSRKQTINFITEDVIEATCQCLLTISDNADEHMHDEEMIKRLIIEEFGRCLTEIIDCSSSRNLS